MVDSNLEELRRIKKESKEISSGPSFLEIVLMLFFGILFFVYSFIFDTIPYIGISSKWSLYFGIFLLVLSFLGYLIYIHYKKEHENFVKKYKGKFSISVKKNF